MDTSHLARMLSGLTVNSDKVACRAVLSKIHRQQSNGYDLKELLPGVLKLLSHHDLVVKKAVYNFLATYASQNPDLALLSVNTLSQECTDSNPMVRGLALKTLCSLNHESFVEYGLSAVNQCLNDKSAYVRRIAVTCCGRFYHQDIDLYNDGGLINQLYGMLRDSDSIVVVNAVMTLEGILKDEGGIVINRKIAHHLLNKLETFTSWGQSYVLTILRKYQPETDDETFDIMNILDTYLTHNNSSVACECLQLFLHLIQKMPHLRGEVFRRSFECLSRAFNHGNHELIFVILEFLHQYREDFIELLKSHHHLLYCKQREPVYLKVKKLNLLPIAANSQNVVEILEEISALAKGSDQQVSQVAIGSIRELMMREPSCVGAAITKLKQLLELDKDHIISGVLQVLQDIELNDAENASEIVSIVSSKLSFLKDEKAKMSFLTILYRYSKEVPDSPYLLEEFMEKFEDLGSVVVKCHALSTCVKIFFSHPASTQGILGRLLETFSQDASAAVRDQAMFYYNVLSQGPSTAEAILL